MINYLDIETILTLHSSLISTYGGEKGVFDINIVKDCLYVPKSVYFNYEMYKSIPEKASAYLFHIAI